MMLICDIYVGTHGLSVLIFPEVIATSMMTVQRGEKRQYFIFREGNLSLNPYFLGSFL